MDINLIFKELYQSTITYTLLKKQHRVL